MKIHQFIEIHNNSSRASQCRKGTKKKLTKLDLDFQDSLTELILGGFNCFFKTG